MPHNAVKHIDVPLPLMQRAVTAVMAFLLRKPPNELVEVDEAEFVEVAEPFGWSRVTFSFKYKPIARKARPFSFTAPNDGVIQ